MGNKGSHSGRQTFVQNKINLAGSNTMKFNQANSEFNCQFLNRPDNATTVPTLVSSIRPTVQVRQNNSTFPDHWHLQNSYNKPHDVKFGTDTRIKQNDERMKKGRTFLFRKRKNHTPLEPRYCQVPVSSRQYVCEAGEMSLKSQLNTIVKRIYESKVSKMTFPEYKQQVQVNQKQLQLEEQLSTELNDDAVKTAELTVDAVKVIDEELLIAHDDYKPMDKEEREQQELMRAMLPDGIYQERLDQPNYYCSQSLYKDDKSLSQMTLTEGTVPLEMLDGCNAPNNTSKLTDCTDRMNIETATVLTSTTPLLSPENRSAHRVRPITAVSFGMNENDLDDAVSFSELHEKSSMIKSIATPSTTASIFNVSGSEQDQNNDSLCRLTSWSKFNQKPAEKLFSYTAYLNIPSERQWKHLLTQIDRKLIGLERKFQCQITFDDKIITYGSDEVRTMQIEGYNHTNVQRVKSALPASLSRYLITAFQNSSDEVEFRRYQTEAAKENIRIALTKPKTFKLSKPRADKPRSRMLRYYNYKADDMSVGDDSMEKDESYSTKNVQIQHCLKSLQKAYTPFTSVF